MAIPYKTKQVKALIDLHKLANKKSKNSYKATSKTIEGIIHKKILLEQLIYTSQQIELQTKFNIKDLNAILETYNGGNDLNPDVVKSTLLNIRNTLTNLKTEQLTHINALVKKLNSQLSKI